MPITWRAATWRDIEESLSFHETHRGVAQVGPDAALRCWRALVRDPFFASAALVAEPAIQGYRLIGIGASVLVSRAFADAEIARPRPDINSRIIASLHSGQSVLATRNEVARANAGDGVDVVVVGGIWHDRILSAVERQEVQTILATSFTQVLSGYRIRGILHETADEPAREFVRRSIVFSTIAEFSELGRFIHLMTSESVRAVPASLGNVIFRYRDPLLRLRDSDQQLLLCALGGATDQELSTRLGLKVSGVKARWRSAFARIEQALPSLAADVGDLGCRGIQKRHRVLAYVRDHQEELRPYDWNMITSSSDANGKRRSANLRSRPASAH
jgi:hypothetical protein